MPVARRYPTGFAIGLVLAIFATPITSSLAFVSLFGAAPPPQAPSQQNRPSPVSPAADPVVADLSGPPRRMSVVHIVEHVATEFDKETGITWYGYKSVAIPVDDDGPDRPDPRPPIPGPEPPDPGDTLGGRVMAIFATVPVADRVDVAEALGAAVAAVRAKVDNETPQSAAVEVVSKAMEALDSLDDVQAVSNFGGLIQEVSPAELPERMRRLEAMLQ